MLSTISITMHTHHTSARRNFITETSHLSLSDAGRDKAASAVTAPGHTASNYPTFPSASALILRMVPALTLHQLLMIVFMVNNYCHKPFLCIHLGLGCSSISCLNWRPCVYLINGDHLWTPSISTSTYPNVRIAIKEIAFSDCQLSKENHDRGFQSSSNFTYMSVDIVIVLPQPRAAVGGQLIPTGVQV